MWFAINNTNFPKYTTIYKHLSVIVDLFSGHGVCDNYTKTYNLPLPTNQSGIIAKHCLLMLRSTKTDITDYRGVSIIVYSNLRDPHTDHRRHLLSRISHLTTLLWIIIDIHINM